MAGLTFAVKDLIDIAGHKTGCGNPSWRDSHPPARSHAVCVEQLLNAGAKFVGKTVSDEVAFSLIGENHFYGTPLNPKAPDRVPGGSSSGSASAVACGLADFALGTDTGGSVRVPASNCGIWGFRPSHDFISMAGVMPFAPTFDTVGMHARSAEVLARAASVLLATPVTDAAGPRQIHVLEEAFDLAEPAVQQVHRQSIAQLQKLFGSAIRLTSLAEIVGTQSVADPAATTKDQGQTTNNEGRSFDSWFDTYCVIQWSEIENSLGPWIADSRPEFGPVTTKSFELVKNLDRRRVPSAVVRRENFYRTVRKFLGPARFDLHSHHAVPAPIKGSLGMNPRHRRLLSPRTVADFDRWFVPPAAGVDAAGNGSGR